MLRVRLNVMYTPCGCVDQVLQLVNSVLSLFMVHIVPVFPQFGVGGWGCETPYTLTSYIVSTSMVQTDNWVSGKLDLPSPHGVLHR